MLSRRCETLIRSILTPQTADWVTNNNKGMCNVAFNYYDALGIKKTSTQNDIKAAYYKLSMQYHPDKNQGSEIAAKKFREITRAYEVLSNYKLRRLYDKGIIHTADRKYARQDDFVSEMEPEVEDDPETKFYKSRFKKSNVSDAGGRQPIYNFDEWTRAHYGSSFQRRQDAKSRWTVQEEQKRTSSKAAENETLICVILFGVTCIYFIFKHESNYDTPKTKQFNDNEIQNLDKNNNTKT